jgi:hypothetical protein
MSQCDLGVIAPLQGGETDCASDAKNDDSFYLSVVAGDGAGSFVGAVAVFDSEAIVLDGDG